LEKGVTLAVALRLRAVLEATGRYDVFLTREGDEYLRLRERVRLARMAGADLFISLHADSLEHDHVLRGASVYTLSDTASSQEAALLAARENRADALVDVALDPDDDMMASILIDLSQRLTRNESSMLAELMVTHLGEATLLMPHQTHRQAGFAVLKAPDVPSVLIEMGYLSNAEDEALLASDEHQAALAEAMARAIESYFSWLDGLQRS
jgi:N-acetylmuramoyl-L-alanine amidase